MKPIRLFVLNPGKTSEPKAFLRLGLAALREEALKLYPTASEPLLPAASARGLLIGGFHIPPEADRRIGSRLLDGALVITVRALCALGVMHPMRFRFSI